MKDKDSHSSKANPEWGLIGAVAAAIGASTCCLGPLILVGLGFSGAWIGSLSAFDRYRPLLMLITFGFLVLAFYKVYSKPKKECCETDNYCANPKADKINKIALWSVTVLVVGLLVSPSIIGASASKAQAITQTIPTKQIVLNVEGMTCAACSVTVSKSLKRVDGVQEANVTLTPPEAVVIYDPARVTVQQLMEVTKNVGYSTNVKGELLEF